MSNCDTCGIKPSLYSWTIDPYSSNGSIWVCEDCFVNLIKTTPTVAAQVGYPGLPIDEASSTCNHVWIEQPCLRGDELVYLTSCYQCGQEQASNRHTHSWTLYQGFTDKYEYCKECGEKR